MQGKLSSLSVDHRVSLSSSCDGYKFGHVSEMIFEPTKSNHKVLIYYCDTIVQLHIPIQGNLSSREI